MRMRVQLHRFLGPGKIGTCFDKRMKWGNTALQLLHHDEPYFTITCVRHNDMLVP
jgi:hypothetical protein